MAGFLGTFYGILTGGGSSRKQVQPAGFDQEVGHDVSIDDDLTVFDLERVQLNERGEVVGLAASIGKDELEWRTSKLPEG
jgi:hypothetical protein